MRPHVARASDRVLALPPVASRCAMLHFAQATPANPLHPDHAPLVHQLSGYAAATLVARPESRTAAKWRRRRAFSDPLVQFRSP
eukprot:6291513-Amphidinium_carterae.2